MKRICVLGNYSGRNAGDNALLEGLMRDVTQVDHGVRFYVPTINPSFVRQAYQQFNALPVSLLPWHGSLKILGFPTLRACLTADVILITDAILFDRHFWNPVHNYLHTLSWILPLAASRGIPVVAYNCHLGPLTSNAGRRAMKRLLRSCDLCILRDEDSLHLMRDLGEDRDDVVIGADCALNIMPTDDHHINEMAAREGILQSDRPLLTVTFSSYLGTVPGRPPADGRRFVTSAAAMVDSLIDRIEVDVVLIVSQHMDLRMNQDVLAEMRHGERVGLISNRTYSHNHLAGVLQRSQMHVSMRTHPMIFASSLSVPVVSIDANPKNVSFLESIGQGDKRISIHDDILTGLAADKVEQYWRMRSQTREELTFTMPAEKDKARRAAEHLAPYVRGETRAVASTSISS